MRPQKVTLPYQALHCGCQMQAIKLNLLWQWQGMKVLAPAGKNTQSRPSISGSQHFSGPAYLSGSAKLPLKYLGEGEKKAYKQL